VPRKNVLEDRVNDVRTGSPNAQRERIIRWDDPLALAEAGRTMSGREFLDAMLRGELPLTPILIVIDFSLDRIKDGRPKGSASGAAIRERNQ
jgi:hypothetical protein